MPRPARASKKAAQAAACQHPDAGLATRPEIGTQAHFERAIRETLEGHRREKQDDFLDALNGFPERPPADQLLRAYKYRDNKE